MSNIANPRVITLILLVIVALISSKIWFDSEQHQDAASAEIISSPQIDDFYFLDFRLLSDNLRPREKYRLAKVVDITGDVITLLYSDFFYVREGIIKESIRFGHLRFKDYFQSKRYDFSHNEIKAMYNAGAITLAKRPVLKKLYGNGIEPYEYRYQSDLFVPGKRENNTGLLFLNEQNLETNLQSAFDLFNQSAHLGFAKGQLNLAEMYVNGQYVDKDFNQALYWFKQASLQSYKPAILKYVIVCKQVEGCDLYGFYKSLIDAGVDIKVRNLDFKLSSNIQ
ncbi:MAG: sel1 repeat family protein [Colwellia sp.]|nr:sel1 repeat family protein [Colwellia sp.]